MGGKREAAPLIADTLLRASGGPWASYTEGFVGAGAVLLHVLSQRDKYFGETRAPEVNLYELDLGTCLFWQSVAVWGKDPSRVVETTETTFNETMADLRARNLTPRDAYAFVRAQYNEHAYLMQKGQVSTTAQFFAYWWILRQTIFNGVWRVNKKGLCNSTWSQRDPHLVSLFDREFVSAVAAVDVALHCTQCDLRSNFVPLIYQADQSVSTGGGGNGRHVAYFDPPYYGGEDKYASESWSAADHRHLIRDCAKLAGRGSVVGYSNHARPEVLEWVAAEVATASGVSVFYTEILTRRSVSAKVKGRVPVPEGFWVFTTA